MKHLIFRRGMLPFIAVLFSFFMVISCQQDDLTSTLSTPTETITSGDSGLKTSDLFTFEPESYDNAFAGIATTRDGLTNYPSADIIQDIYNLIMIENEEHDFVDHLVNTHGLPEWNFSIMKGDANGDYVVSIPFVVDPISNVIDGVLKYYHSPNEQVITFATKDGADDMLVTPINELNLDYATGILFDFSIFEYTLYDMENIPYADFFKAHAAELDDLSGQPRSYYVCVPVLIDWYQKGGDGDWAYTGTTTRTDYLLINGTLSGGSNNVWSDILIKVTTKTGSSNTGNGNSGSGNSGNGNERPNTPLVDLTPEERDCLKQGGLETSFRMTSLSKSISPCPDIRMDEIIENAIQSIYAAGECDDPEAFYDAVDAQIQSLYETCEIRTVTLCLEPEDLYSLPDDPLGGYYINLLHLGVNYLDTDTGDQIFTNFPQFCIQVNKSFGSLLPGRTRSKYKIQQAIRMSIQGVQAQLDGYMIPPTSVAAKEEFKLLLRQNLAGAFGGGTSFTTAGCPGVPTMVADMSCF